MTATRIQISRRTARWDDAAVRVGDAMDFWSFAAGAANVVMQMSRQKFEALFGTDLFKNLGEITVAAEPDAVMIEFRSQPS